MNTETVLTIAQESLVLALVLTALPTLAALVVGLIIAVLQAATQVQEQTLTVVPKIVAVFAVLMVGGQWMVTEMVSFARALFERFYFIGLGG